MSNAPKKVSKRANKADSKAIKTKSPEKAPKQAKEVKEAEVTAEVADSEGVSTRSKSVEPKMRKSEIRQEKKVTEAKARKVEREYLTEKYDKNLANSDDSSDEEVLLRTGNVPKEWYDLYDHKGYSVKGKQVEKPIEADELTKFIER